VIPLRAPGGSGTLASIPRTVDFVSAGAGAVPIACFTTARAAVIDWSMNDGDTFSREKIASGLENLRKAYGDMGYINFTSVPDTKFDDERRLISLVIDVDEGKLFHVGSVNVLGLDEQARQELLKELPFKRGQIYTSKLWEKLLLLKYGSMIPECECRTQLGVNEQAGAVAVTLDFRPCSTD